MWGKTLDRARRHLRSTPPPPPVAPAGNRAGADHLVVALARPELERLVGALAAFLDPDMPRPDSPARLAGAIGTAIERIGGKGQATVTRSPAGLYTPEYWHVRIVGADARTRGAIATLATGGRLGA